MDRAARDLLGWVGGVEPEAYERAEVLQDLAALDFRPKFIVEGPVPAAREGPGAHVHLTYFTYEFSPRAPWLPEQIVGELRRLFNEKLEAGAFEGPAMNIVYELEAETGPAAAPFGRTATAKAHAFAQAAHPISIKKEAPETLDWGRLTAIVTRADEYDKEEGVVEIFGNRMSRICFTVQDFRIPRGNGVALDLGLPPKAIVELPEVDGGLCGQACLAYAEAATPDIRKKLVARPASLRTAAVKMAIALGVGGGMSVTDFDRYTALHPEQPVVIMAGRTEVRYRTVSTDEEMRFKNPPYYFLQYGDHYYVINNIVTFARPTADARSEWCHQCCRLIDAALIRKHACEGRCVLCKHYFVSEEDRVEHFQPCRARCPDCNFEYQYAGCRPRHRCNSWLCLACRKTAPLAHARAHRCGESYCRECSEATPAGEEHRCFMLQVSKGSASEEVWVYDIECTLDVKNERGDTTHAIAMIVAQKLYTREVMTFTGARVEQDFLHWVESMHHATTLIAHNAASYDAYLILQACRKHKLCLPKQAVVVGSKIPYMQYKNVRFIDSMKHIAGSLDQLAKTFGLPLHKGYFPYRFYTTTNRGYTGDIPARDWFDYGAKPVEWRAEFDKWYETFRPGGYSLEDEALKYCRQDVEILCLAMEKYRDAGLAMNGIDPLQSVAAASLAMKTYRAIHMPPKTFPILNREEYNFVRRGFMGGRTEVRQLHCVFTPEDVAAGRYLKHVDVVSMYPTIQMYDPLPCGTPWWFGGCVGPDECVRWILALAGAETCAMVHCDVECPRNLHHPVLLEKRDEKLVAALDITSGVWPSNELELAIENGYRITAIHRALCSKTKKGLFASYIEEFIALKQRHAKDGEEPNPGKCALAKIMLNSLWGKFGQRDQALDSRFYTSETTWFKAVTGLTRGVFSNLDVHEITGEYVFATTTAADNENLHLRTTDLLLAAFVTSSGRVRLYRGGHAIVGERFVLCDTDSIIYVAGPGLADIPTGHALGDWKDETGGDPITELVALGKKTYAYDYTAAGVKKSVVKCKGFASGFTLGDYRGLVQAYFAGTTLALAQESLHFVRRCVKGAAQSMTTIADYTKKLMVSMNSVEIVSPTCTRPYGYAA